MRPALGGRESLAGWAFLLPALSLLGIFFVIPVLAGFILSFTDFDVYAIGSPDTARFVGLRNYVRTLASSEFWHALKNTLVFVVLGGPLSVLTSLIAALLLNERLVRFRSFFRTAFFTPVVTTIVAVAIVWRYLYHPHYGLLNYILGLVGIEGVDWLGDPTWAMPGIVLLSVWKNFGYNMLIFVAGLQTIPEELYEAAEVDGAGTWQRFRHVTLPGLASTFLFVGVTTMIGFFQLFTEPYVMTQGGPLRSTTTVVLLMYEQGFRWWRMGPACAIAFILLAITLAGTFVQLRLQRDTR
jgi:multiple sugar transport system permease protein